MVFSALLCLSHFSHDSCWQDSYPLRKEFFLAGFIRLALPPLFPVLFFPPEKNMLFTKEGLFKLFFSPCFRFRTSYSGYSLDVVIFEMSLSSRSSLSLIPPRGWQQLLSA